MTNLEKLLQPFLVNNPDAKLKDENGQVAIVSPWGDESIIFPITEQNEKLIEALNSIYLPSQLYAIVHADLKAIEFIYTPFFDQKSEEPGRSFTFNFDDKSFQCEFSSVSERLLLLADSCQLLREKGPLSSFRNLDSFKHYLSAKKDKRPFAETLIPTSFWIKGIDWDDNGCIELCQHLNFYMRYFDFRSPRIIISQNDLSQKKVTRTELFKNPNDCRISYSKCYRCW